MRIFLFLVLLGIGQLALAAENALPVQDADQVEATDSTPASPGSSQSNAEDGGDLIAAEVTETNEAEEESSVRFIPTEEISQDLGVSFPIDI